MPTKKQPNSSNEGAPAQPITGPTISVTFTGPEATVRRTLHSLRFTSEWNKSVTRGIALDQTLNPNATLDDTLGGAKLHQGPNRRTDYRLRCMEIAASMGHPIASENDIPADEDTTVEMVGDALYDKSAH